MTTTASLPSTPTSQPLRDDGSRLRQSSSLQPAQLPWKVGARRHLNATIGT